MGREGEGKQELGGRGNQPHIPSPGCWVGWQGLGSLDRHPLALALARGDLLDDHREVASLWGLGPPPTDQ